MLIEPIELTERSSTQVKKVKAKSDDEKSFKMKENPFQKVYEQQYMKNDKSKFIKSL